MTDKEIAQEIIKDLPRGNHGKPVDKKGYEYMVKKRHYDGRHVVYILKPQYIGNSQTAKYWFLYNRWDKMKSYPLNYTGRDSQAAFDSLVDAAEYVAWRCKK